MADIYINKVVKTLYKYFMSRKNTYNAERINPTPKLKSTRQKIGKNKVNYQC